MLDLLGALVDASLVQLAPGAGGVARYRMLETIREYAAEQLAAHGEERAARDAHARYALAFAEQHESFRVLCEDATRLDAIEAELGDLRAALAWLSESGLGAEVARLAAALSWFWFVRGYLYEGRAWLEQAHGRHGDAPIAERATIAIVLSWILQFQGDFAASDRLAAEGLTLAHDASDLVAESMALSGLGTLAIAGQNYDRASADLESALALAQELDDARVSGSLAALILGNLGVVARGHGRLAAAAAYHQEALAAVRAAGAVWLEVYPLGDLGDVARDRGDVAQAARCYRESLKLAWDDGNKRAIVETLEGIAWAAATSGGALAAARWFAAAARARALSGITARHPVNSAAYEHGLAAARATLGDERFAAAWLDGHSRPLAETVAEALTAAEPATSPRGSLSPREMEVLRLLATGLPDREISDSLFLSVRTVEAHVARILANLGVHTRTAAVTAALTAGIVAHEPAPSPAVFQARDKVLPRTRRRTRTDGPEPRAGLRWRGEHPPTAKCSPEKAPPWSCF